MDEERFHILLVEDNPEYAWLVQQFLTEPGLVPFKVTHVDRLAAALAALATDDLDAVLLDLHLPDGAGLDTLLQVQASAPHLPVVVLTSMEDEALGIRLVQAGAEDYLIKSQVTSPPSHRILRRVLHYAIERRRAAAEREQLVAELNGERQQAAASAVEAQRRADELEAVFAALAEAVVIYDADGGIRQANPAAIAAYGLDPAASDRETLVRHLAIHHADGRPVLLEELPSARALRGETVTGERYLFTNVEGRRLIILASAAPLWTKGAMSGAVAIWHDVTEHERLFEAERLALAAAERALRARDESLAALHESERRFRRLVEANPIGILLATTDVITQANDAFLEMVGYTHEDLARGALRWQVMTPPEYAHLDEQALEELHAEGICTPFEKEYWRKDGSRVPILIGATLLERSPPEWVCFVLDLTERKQAEAERAQLLAGEQAARRAAEASEQRLAFLAEAGTILASSLDYEATLRSVTGLVVPSLADYCGVYLVDEHGEIRQLAVAHVNPMKVSLLQEWWDHDTPTLGSPSPIAQVLRTGEPELVTEISADWFEALGQSGPRRRVLQELNPKSFIIVPFVARERTIGCMSLVSSESGRSYGPADLSLAEEVARRSALAIDNARLYQEAQKAVRLRDQFLSVASHELRTPVTALQGYAELVQRRASREGRLNPRDSRALNVIREQAVRLNQLIDLLLDLSRIQTGRLTIEHAPVDLTALARRMTEGLRATLEQHIVELIAPDAPLLVEGDTLRLEQVVQNLLDNAVKYSPAGGSVGIRLARQDGQAVLAVSDYGIGIPPEELSHLFEPFFRATNTQAYRIQGEGLGLAVVKEIIKLHRGTIEVESTEGKGSTFTVCLPTLPATAEDGS